MSEPLSPLLVDDQPKWPMAIAGASIATGGVALLPGCYSLIKSAVQTWTLFQPLRELSGHWLGFWTDMLVSIAVPLLLLLSSALLLWAGLRCWKRQRYAAGLHITWALVCIGSVCAGLIFVYLASRSPDFPGAGGKNGFPWRSAIIMLLSLGYPIFVLVWFMRKKVRGAVAKWRARHRNQLDFRQFVNWPYAIAGASIALASSDVLGACYLLVRLAAMAVPDKLTSLAISILWAALYGLLLWAGIACWRHQRRTARMHIGFAIAYIALSLRGHFLGNSESVHWDLALADREVSTTLGLTYQVFLLVWFTRGKVRQTIAGWDKPIAVVENIA